MVSKADKNVARLRRHKRVRGKISGTPERPRLDVFRSNMHIYAQIIDDVNGVTLCAASSVSSTAASKSWPTAPARAASTSKKEEYCFGYEN